MRKHYELVFTFEFFDDIIIYKTKRDCTSRNAIMSYAADWVKKFGNKYGECIRIEISECVDNQFEYVWVMKGV